MRTLDGFSTYTDQNGSIVAEVRADSRAGHDSRSAEPDFGRARSLRVIAVGMDHSLLITVMTYNVANGLARPENLLPLLRDSGADVIALQELATDQSQAIASGLHDIYPHMSLFPGGIPGKGLLSRTPIESEELIELHPDRPDLKVGVMLNGIPLTFLVAHPPPPRLHFKGLVQRPHAQKQLQSLLDLTHAGGPSVLLGDFNLHQRHPVYATIRDSGLTDSFAAVGRGTGQTLPKRMARWAYQGNRLGNVTLPAMVRIDYVWHTHHLRSLEAWVGDHGGSDHLPVLARLALAEHDRS